MQGLEELRLVGNRLKMLPPELGLLRDLRILAADSNELIILPGEWVLLLHLLRILRCVVCTWLVVFMPCCPVGPCSWRGGKAGVGQQGGAVPFGKCSCVPVLTAGPVLFAIADAAWCRRAAALQSA